MKISDISIRRPVFASMVSAALVLFGVIGYSRLAVREYPDVDPPIVSVSTELPGANPQVVESAVTDILEEELSTVQGLRTLTSSSQEGKSNITLEFTLDRPVVFAYHGYPWLIHRLTYRRTNHDNIHVRGYIEEGTTTTPFDMVMLNNLDRFHLVMDVIDRVPGLRSKAAHVRQLMEDERLRCRQYTRENGDDAPDIRSWVWPS